MYLHNSGIERASSGITGKERLQSGLLTLGIVLVFLGWLFQSSLPTVHMADGQCIKVEVYENGQIVDKLCSSIDLVDGRYNVLQVAGPSDQTTDAYRSPPQDAEIAAR